MDKTVRVMWTALDTPVGKAVLAWTGFHSEVEIAAGVVNPNYKNKTWLKKQKIRVIEPSMLKNDQAKQLLRGNVDVVLYHDCHFSYTTVAELAKELGVPLIIREPISEKEQTVLQSASGVIPVFCDTVVGFRIKDFIDRAVDYAVGRDHVSIVESGPHGEKGQHPVTVQLQKKLNAVTSKDNFIMSNIYSEAKYFMWAVDYMQCEEATADQLARDLIKITKSMAHGKTPGGGSGLGGSYTLDDLWDELNN